jgi:tetratricopeptide (TPR) repeat protein
MEDPSEIIQRAEKLIEDAVWHSMENEDLQKETAAYSKAKLILESIKDIPPDIQPEHDRVMSYCLMRISDTQSKLGEDADISLIKTSLELAERSGDPVQIARSTLAFGIKLLNQGQVSEAEVHFRRIFTLSEEMKDNRDMQQVLGWMFIVRTNILLGKSLYDQAFKLAQDAINTLHPIENYAGLRVAYRLLAKCQIILGNNDEANASLRMAEKYETLAKEHHQ